MVFLLIFKILLGIALEFLFGFSMAVITFGMLPLSVEIAGVKTVCFGILTGIFLFFILQRFMGSRKPVWAMLCCIALFFYHFFPLPFSAYDINGFFSGILAGIALSAQILYLSDKQYTDKHLGFMDFVYLLGLIMGIILKS